MSLKLEGNSDIERYQMANKKIPFKYSRPVEEWLQEKGNCLPALYWTWCVCARERQIHTLTPAEHKHTV